MNDSTPTAPVRSRARRVLASIVLAIAAITVAVMVLTWPGTRPGESAPGQSLDTVAGEVIKVEQVECQVPDARGCNRATARIEDGPDAGETGTFIIGDSSQDVQVDVGDRVRLVKSQVDEATLGGIEIEPYSFSDYERRSPLWILAAIFVVIVLVSGRWHGLRALVGLALSVGVIILYIVPGLLAGEHSILIAMTGAFAVLLLTVPLAHGWGPVTISATLGTATSLLLTLGLAMLFTELAKLTGFASEEAAYLSATANEVSIRGLLLAGIVIAALGVLDDVTVTQSSTVLALRHANPSLGFGQLFRRAMRVGRDHITATVNTLVLAYAGASLPALLVFAVADVDVSTALNGEAVAGQIVATLVGSIGLIAAVPVTTALATVLALGTNPTDIDPHAGHTHGH
ncbi:MAG: YibE/F family protein [Thermoleophilia bacterium]|nr:YibE/F family protein [Thermoleophilia bacterium]